MKHISVYLLMFLCGCICFGCHKNKEVILNMEVEGVIISIYQDRKKHEFYTFTIKSNSWYDGTFIADFYPKSWLYASIGDSIIKKKSEDFITIKKRNGSSMTFKTRIK